MLELLIIEGKPLFEVVENDDLKFKTLGYFKNKAAAESCAAEKN